MTSVKVDAAQELAGGLIDRGFAPFYGTPCGILSRLYRAIEDQAGLQTVPREDNAVGLAAGGALAGRCPVVLMQNSGLGQSVNALASLVTPYRLAMLLVVSLRGVHPDPTQENLVMGRLTEPLLADLGLPTLTVDATVDFGAQVDWAAGLVRDQRRPAALLIPPETFGWRA
jgi:sulfopyruvate decarboxylase subunit alpha